MNQSHQEEQHTPTRDIPTISIENTYSEKKSEISSSGADEQDEGVSYRRNSQAKESDHRGSFLSQGGQDYSNPNFERSVSADAGSFKRAGSNNSSFKVEPFDGSLKDELAVPDENEEIERKNTIRVLSKYDAEKTPNNTNLTLEKMLARNAGKEGRERKKTADFSSSHQQESHPHSSLTDALVNSNKLHRDTSKIFVPEDSLDVFDAEDQRGSEINSNVDENECLVVTQNPLISSYKIQMTDVATCPTLTNTFYDTETKKSYEPTIIKV